ncbi:hypothetical protein ACQ5SO_04075 [Rhodovulum sp. DZ06]|uniref:hypothetical protein n=1 Tax=Rhodovulum sp. DZ06 TaxID=3425126 RepID=UPI003D33B717
MRWDRLKAPDQARFDPLLPAEVRLIKRLRGQRDGAEVDHQGVILISDHPPGAQGPDDTLRAEVLLHLLLRKDPRAPLPKRGLRIAGARIEGALDLEGAELSGDLGFVSCSFDAPPNLRGASCRSLFFHGSTMPGFAADRLRCSGSLFLIDAHVFAAPVRLLRADIKGSLNCSGAEFDGRGGAALEADGITLGGGIAMSEDFHASGSVRLPGAQVGGSLDCDGATMIGHDRGAEGGPRALQLDRACIAGDVSLREGFEAHGEVRLIGAQVGGTLNCNGARLDGKGEFALSADRGRITGTVCLGRAAPPEDGEEGAAGRAKRFSAVGSVRFIGAEINGNLECYGGDFDGDGRTALDLSSARVDGAVCMRSGFSAKGVVNFTGASFGAIEDERDCWCRFQLVDCSYGTIRCDDGSFRPVFRLEWLDGCATARPGPDFHPGPFEQLAKVFRDSGHPEYARRILIAKERRLRTARHDSRLRASPLGWLTTIPFGIWTALLDRTVRFGHKSLRAFRYLFVAVALGDLGFFIAAEQDAIKPNSPFVLRAPEWVACAAPLGGAVIRDDGTALSGRALPGQSQLDCFTKQPEAASWPRFNALVYSVDTLFPLVDLEMQTHWIPDERKNGERWYNSIGWWARTYLWLHIAAGWALSLLAVAGFSGIVKSD